MTPLLAIPAAGKSARMLGQDKLLEVVWGEPLLARQIKTAKAAGLDVAVLLGPDMHARQNIAETLGVAIHLVPQAHLGMSETLKVASNLAKDRSLGILLADVPGISPDDITSVYKAFEASGCNQVARASDPDGRPGTPIFFPPALHQRFCTLSGDDGGRGLLADQEISLVRFEDDRATCDLDTPQDWENWRLTHPDA